MLKPHEYSLLQHLSRYVTDHKKEYIDQVLAQRTRYVTVVLENIFQSQNASAAIRTCECIGLQDVHVIEDEGNYRVNKNVLRGADKWMNISRHNTGGLKNTGPCFDMLRAKGYRILCADPAKDGKAIQAVDVTSPLALVFGNELNGLSDYALGACDEKVHIPMFGFTESFNISVSVAISLHTVMSKIRAASLDCGLTPGEKDMLKLVWYRKILRRSEIMEREFLRTNA